MRTRNLSLAPAALAALFLAACGDNGGSAEADLPDDLEGELTFVCSPNEELCAAWADAFEAETGVQTSFVRLSAGEALARLQAGGEVPEFDVWHGGPADTFIAAIEEGLLAPYQSPVAEEIDDELKDAEGYWTGIYLGAIAFCSNQDRLDELGVDAPESWDDLLDPAFAGELSMAHPATSGTSYTLLWTQVERLGGEDAAIDYMRELDQNVLQYTRSGSAPAQMAGRGEVTSALMFAHGCQSQIEEGFDNLTISFPEETGYEIGAVAMIEGTQNEENAQAYIDWALSPAAQDIGPEEGNFQSLTHPESISDDRMVNLDDINLVDYDFERAGESRIELTQRFDDEIAEEPAEDAE
ncbi:ABC transporter substrate-binding protein [Nesterenkonia alkaliphila]|uniref:Extracellular solute-binding protein n=1 Tax=Nesterenkonia alkaliphila TaxID=1463631 RepID=A0A7K1UJD5_9MICC|nr:ABC transporter substrate-binding protein [Nesterenkonia alkaliphila]MVT26587.1 extracellular solute-binding protein [Nesterenkonia alkaliphila]GFZ78688.1 iron ABC transporter substrate-binding protein [Nesterenkonia alkaliphila]